MGVLVCPSRVGPFFFSSFPLPFSVFCRLQRTFVSYYAASFGVVSALSGRGPVCAPRKEKKPTKNVTSLHVRVPPFVCMLFFLFTSPAPPVCFPLAPDFSPTAVPIPACAGVRVCNIRVRLAACACTGGFANLRRRAGGSDLRVSAYMCFLRSRECLGAPALPPPSPPPTASRLTPPPKKRGVFVYATLFSCAWISHTHFTPPCAAPLPPFFLHEVDRERGRRGGAVAASSGGGRCQRSRIVLHVYVRARMDEVARHHHEDAGSRSPPSPSPSSSPLSLCAPCKLLTPSCRLPPPPYISLSPPLPLYCFLFYGPLSFLLPPPLCALLVTRSRAAFVFCGVSLCCLFFPSLFSFCFDPLATFHLRAMRFLSLFCFTRVPSCACLCGTASGWRRGVVPMFSCHCVLVRPLYGA